MKLDGPNFRNKPSGAITVAAWLNAYSLSDEGSVQQIFIAKDSKERGTKKTFLFIMLKEGLSTQWLE